MTWETLQRLGRENAEAHEVHARRAGRRPPAPATWPRSSTRPARPARRRASCRRTATTCRDGRVHQGDARSQRWLGPPAVPAAGPFVRAAGIVPGHHHGLTTAFAESIDKLAREPAGGRGRTSLQRAARVREGLRGRAGQARPGRRAKRKIFQLGARRSAGVELTSSAASRCRPASSCSGGSPTSWSSPSSTPARAAACESAISGGAPLAPRHRRVLPRRRHPAPGGLRPDRDLSGADVQPARSVQVRLGRSGAARGRAEDRADGEILARGANIATRLLQAAGGDARGASSPTAGSTPATSGAIDEDGFLFITDRRRTSSSPPAA